MGLFFVSGNEEADYYHPDRSTQSLWQTELEALGVVKVTFDIANKVAKGGGITHLLGFYGHRDIGDVGFKAAAKYTKEKKVPLELEAGFDSTLSNSLYQK